MTNCQPIRVHPDAPHYLEYRGRPIILITSAEHYGAVINGDFDLVTYLDALAAFEMNYTRIYPGAYFETEGFFGCDGNTLGPRAGRHVLPWARSGTGEYPLGGSLFDLDTWDPQYFERLRTFARLAADRDIIVEICFYNVMYPQVWDFMPMNAKNNIQGVGECDFSQVQSVANTDLLSYQVEYVPEDRPRAERVRQHHLRDHRRAWQLRRPARRILRLDRPHARRSSRRRSRPQQAALSRPASPRHDRWRWRLLPRSAC